MNEHARTRLFSAAAKRGVTPGCRGPFSYFSSRRVTEAELQLFLSRLHTVASEEIENSTSSDSSVQGRSRVVDRVRHRLENDYQLTSVIVSILLSWLLEKLVEYLVQWLIDEFLNEQSVSLA